MNHEDFLTKLKNRPHKDILRDSTVTYLSNLPGPLGDAALCAAILRWFNAEVLDGILETDPSVLSAEQLYEQLQKLPFTEEFSGRGHSFHEMTRKNVLEHLWNENGNFYHRVSRRAAAFFEKEIENLNLQISQGEIEPDEFDMGISVEMMYHLLIADEEKAIFEIDDLLAHFISTNQMGYYHDMIEAAAEHAAAGRLPTRHSLLIDFWRIQEAYGNQDIAELEAGTHALLEVPDTDTSLPRKLHAMWLLAEGFRINAQYDRANHYFEECYDRAQALKDPFMELKSIIGLGYVAYDTDRYTLANDYFVEALARRVQEIRSSLENDELCNEETPLNVFSPYAWHRVDGASAEDSATAPADKPVDHQAKAADDSSPAETLIPVIPYLIDIDREALEGDDVDFPENAACPVNADIILAEAWFQIGLIQSDLNDYHLAIGCVELATQMYLDAGELTEVSLALDSLESLANTIGDEQYSIHARNLRNLLIDEARQSGDRLAELQGLIDQARSFYKDGKYKDASDIYKEAHEISEKLGNARIKAASLNGLANVDWTEGRYERASSTLQTALALYEQAMDMRGQASIMISLGELKLQMRQISEAFGYFNAALKIYQGLRSATGEFDTLVTLSNAAQNQAAYDEAYGYLASALKLAQKDEGLTLEASALGEIGKLNLAFGSDAAAEVAFSKALEIAQRIGRHELEKRLQLDKIDVLVSLAEYEKAVELCHFVIEKSPADAMAHRHLGWAYEFLGDRYAADSLNAYEKAVEAVPDDWWAHNGIATALRLMGDEEKAKLKLRWLARRIEQGSTRPHLSTLGWCYYHLGEYEKALAIYQQEMERSSHSVSSKFDLALVLLCMGKHAEGADEYKRGIDLINQTYPERRRLGYLSVAIMDIRRAIKRNADLAGVTECLEVLQLLEQSKAAAAQTKTMDKDIQLDNAVRCNHRAMVYNRLGQKQFALIEYERAIELEPENAASYANRAQLYLSFDKPDTDRASADIDKAIELEARNADHHYARAQFYIQQNNYDTALEDINRAMEIRPKDINLIACRSIIYNLMDRKDEVLADISRIIEIAPNDPEGYKICADYHARSGNHHEAINYYSKAIKLQPDNAMWYNERANLRTLLEDWQAAMRDYNQAIRLDPKKAVYYSNRALAYLSIETPDRDNALTDLNKAIELEARNADHYFSRAEFYAQQQNYNSALADINRAIELRPEDALLISGRASIYRSLGKEESALSDFSSIIEIQPEHPDGYILRGRFLFEAGKYEDALKDFSKAVEYQPDNLSLYISRAKVHQTLNQNELALKDLEHVIEQQPEVAESYNIRGFFHIETGDVRAAMDDFTFAIELNSDEAAYYVNRAAANRALKNYDQALEDINHALKLKANDVGSLYLRADIYAQSGNFEDALDDYNTLSKFEENDSNLYINRGHIYLNIQNYEEAINDFSRAINLKSDISSYYNFRALANIDNENYDAALSDLDISDEIDRNDNMELCYNLLWRGLVYLLTNQEAKHLWENAITMAQLLTDQVNKHRLLALATMFMGDIDAAQKHYQSLLALKPDQHHLNLQLNYLQRIKRLFPDRSDVVGLVEWFEKQM